MKAIVFGASGQDGYYLAGLLADQKIKTIRVSRYLATAGQSYDHALRGSVADFPFVARLVSDVEPHYIFQLAAVSSLDPNVGGVNHAAIATGTFNVLEAVRLHSPRTRVFVAGSGLQFLNVGRSLDEHAPFEASSAYAAARIAATYTARYFRYVHGLCVSVGYLFNHDSPRRGLQHFCQKVAYAAARAKSGRDELLTLDNIAAVREFVFAGDAVRAMWQLINDGSEAVIGNGIGHTLGDWVRACYGATPCALHDKGETPAKRLVSDPHTIRALGWKPTVDMVQLADMMVRAASV